MADLFINWNVISKLFSQAEKEAAAAVEAERKAAEKVR